MMAAAWILLALTTGFEPLIVEEQVTTIELNRFYDSDGKLVFSQWLFWDEELSLIDWRMKKCDPCIEGGAMLWIDDGVFRKVRFRQYRESHTQHDPELWERERLPKEQRRGLRKR